MLCNLAANCQQLCSFAVDLSPLPSLSKSVLAPALRCLVLRIRLASREELQARVAAVGRVGKLEISLDQT